MSERGWLQLAGLTVMTLLAIGLLVLIGYLAGHALDNMKDGRVPVQDAGLMPMLVLAFREVIGLVGKLWDHQATSEATAALSNSAPTLAPNPPAGDGTA